MKPMTLRSRFGTKSRKAKRLVRRTLGRLGWELYRSSGKKSLSLRRRPALGLNPLGDIRTILGERVACLFDVGGHIGETALEFADAFPQARIYSFEPDSSNFESLVAQCAPYRQIVPVPKAVSNRDGSATLHRTVGSLTHSLLKPSQTASHFLTDPKVLSAAEDIVVPTVSLDTFCMTEGIKRIDVLKIDAQGAELSILEGGRRLLSERAVTFIYLEVNFVAFYDGSPLFPEVYERLYSSGYRLVGLYDLGFATHYYQVGCNALFIEEQAGTLRRAG